jgi:hypothetical protein
MEDKNIFSIPKKMTSQNSIKKKIYGRGEK